MTISAAWLPLSAVMSAALAGILYAAIRRDRSTRLLLLLALLPFLAVYLWNPLNRIYSFHGFMHISIVYQILNGFIPPDSPLLAGNPLLYPWGHHLVTAGMVQVLRISPATAFALGNLFALLLTLIVVFRIAAFLSPDRTTRICAVFLSIFGITLFNGGPIAYPFMKLTGRHFFSLRSVPASKFTNMNSMPLGILFFALFLCFVARVLSSRTVSFRHLLILTLSVAGAGFFYPLALLAILTSGCALCAVCTFRRITNWPAIAYIVLCITFGAAIAAPYLIQIAPGKSAVFLTLTPGLHSLILKGSRLFFSILPLGVVVYWKRAVFMNPGRRSAATGWVLITAAGANALAYLLFSFPGGAYAEYKFLLLSCFAFGIYGGAGLGAVHSSHRLLWFMLVFSFLLPASFDWIMKLDRSSWVVSHPLIEDGIHLHHAEPDEDALYCWIADHTERDAVFLDTRLTIPVFGRRMLFIGMDDPGDFPRGPIRNGWFFTARRLVGQEGHPSDNIEARLRIAREVYSDTQEISQPAIEVLRRISSERNLYVVAREAAVNTKLLHHPDFTKVYDGGVRTVFKMTGNLSAHRTLVPEVGCMREEK